MVALTNHDDHSQTSQSLRRISGLNSSTKRNAIALTMVIAVLALAALFVYVFQAHNIPSKIHAASNSNSATKSKTTAGKAKTDTTASSSGSSTAVSVNKSISSNDAATVGPCSSVLTAAQAKSVLGGSPTSKGNNGTTSQTTDITTITCGYTYGSDTITTVEYKANTLTGQHENDDQFGSSRPSGVTAVTGYGQAAYWQSSTGLSILQNNNWYVVSFTDNSSLNETNSIHVAQAAGL